MRLRDREHRGVAAIHELRERPLVPRAQQFQQLLLVLPLSYAGLRHAATLSAPRRVAQALRWISRPRRR